VIYLDTHVAVWLAAGEGNRLSRRAQKLVNTEPLAISPAVLLEIEFLKEIGRVRASAEEMFGVLSEETGLSLCREEFANVVKRSLREKWTRVPFDQLIVSQAALAGEQLLSKYQNILIHYAKAFWD
jgi:PIN domain nuclease of toxin-antitoxin system